MVYQKARELGTLIMESDYAKVLNEARLAYEQNERAKQKFEEYTAYKALYIHNLRQNLYSPQEAKSDQQKLKTMSHDLETEEDIMYLINAEEDFNNYVNKIMSILKSMIMGGESCSGSCSGMGCSHKRQYDTNV